MTASLTWGLISQGHCGCLVSKSLSRQEEATRRRQCGGPVALSELMGEAHRHALSTCRSQSGPRLAPGVQPALRAASGAGVSAVARVSPLLLR